MIFCALSNHTTKVRQAQAAIIRFSTLPYDSARFHTFTHVIWQLGASWRFTQVIHDEPYLARGEPFGGLTVPTAHAVGHLHLRHVEVPGACTQLRGLLLVLAEVAAEGSSCSPDSSPFPAPPICRQIAHHAAHFLQILVGTRKFCTTYVRFQEREKYWNDGLMYVFCRFQSLKRQIFRASAQVLHAWRGDFADDLSRFCILSYSRVCCKLLVISL